MHATDITGYPFQDGDILNFVSVNQICESIAKETPIASETEAGVVKVGDNLIIDEDGKLSAIFSDATSDKSGLMSQSDKTKLDGIPEHIIDDLNTNTTSTWSSSKISKEIANVWFKVEVVDSLPEIGNANTIYFVSDEGDDKSEYMWIDEKWELIGTTKVDLTDYVTRVELTNGLAKKQDTLIAGNGLEIDNNTISSYPIIKTTYNELKSLRGSGKLVGGLQYRITDYQTTTSQEDTMSAGHVFDVIVTADDESTLNENVRFCLHEGDDYFSECNIAAWEGKYCLDNDANRFAWADTTNGTGVIYYLKDEHNNECYYDFKNIMFKRWAIESVEHSKLTEKSLNYLKSKFVYTENGGKYFAVKGVDENYYPSIATVLTNEYKWYYTFHGLHSEDGQTISEDYDLSTKQYSFTDECISMMNENGDGANTKDECKNNSIQPAYLEYFNDDEWYVGRQILNNNVFISDLSYCYHNEDNDEWIYNALVCNNNKFDTDCIRNTLGYSTDCYFGCGCKDNTFNDGSHNTLGAFCHGNICGTMVYNKFGSNCNSNIFTYGCSNTLDDLCSANCFCASFEYNKLGNMNGNNTFGEQCCSNTFGSHCEYNNFGQYFTSCTLGNDITHNNFGQYIKYMTIFDGARYLDVSGGTSMDSCVQNAQILNGLYGDNDANKLTISFAENKSYTQLAGFRKDGDSLQERLKIWGACEFVF